MIFVYLAVQAGAGMSYEPATADRGLAAAASASAAIASAAQVSPKGANPVVLSETGGARYGGVWPRPTINSLLRDRIVQHPDRTK